MPIPFSNLEARDPSERANLQLVSPPSAVTAPAKQPLFIVARSIAHLLDLALVLGASSAAAKGLSLVILYFYHSQIEAFGSGAAGVFLDAFTYASGQLFSACAGFFSVLYFIGLPAWTGRTFGLGLLGLRIENRDGGIPGITALGRRLLSCVLIYVSGGSLLLSSLRSRESKLPQDSFSETYVRKVI